MAYADYQAWLKTLETRGELHRVKVEVDPKLEISEILDRLIKKEGGGPALLFEKVKGSPYPLAINTFTGESRMALSLCRERVEVIAEEIDALLRFEAPDGFWAKLKTLPLLASLLNFPPKKVDTGICQEVIEEGDAVDLTRLPVMTCWPEDGGPFITLPLVFTEDPQTKRRNVGMYRMQVYDRTTTGMHWHVHHDGARHYRGYAAEGRRMPVSVALGGDPALIYAATAPLPPDVDEMVFAGFLRKENVALVKCRTNDLYVPASSEFVLEGYVEPAELRTEGPFGDHTGFYSLEAPYPVFHCTCITRRKNPVYPSILVGRPPMEDTSIGRATSRIFLPFLKRMIPELVDLHLPDFGVFHNVVFVSIDKQYPGQAQKVMNALWGLGQMALTKWIVVFDKEVNVRNEQEALFYLGNNIDPGRDCLFMRGPVDVLDHAATKQGLATKLGIDATRKLPAEGFDRPWPSVIRMSADIQARVEKRWTEYGLGEG